MKKELYKIIMELDEWNNKYNKGEYLSIGCVEGNWMISNSTEKGKKFFDYFIMDNEMEKMKEKNKNEENEDE